MCPGCERPDDPDGLGVRDTRDRLWCGDCARKALAKHRRNTVGCCPGCGDFIGDATALKDARNRPWHFTNEGSDCVAALLGTLA